MMLTRWCWVGPELPRDGDTACPPPLRAGVLPRCGPHSSQPPEQGPTSLPVPLSLCQEQLPATGVPITRQRFDRMRSMFDEYVRSSTLHNWKFWIVSFGAGACCLLQTTSTKQQVLWFTHCSWVCGVSPAQEALGTTGRCVPLRARGGDMPRRCVGGNFCYKSTDGVGVNGGSSGRRSWWS